MKFKQKITVRHLRLIQALGRELSISRCAERLNTSQSAVSRGLGEIETLLGASLFERTTRRVTPTPVGQNMIWHAEQILAQLDRAEADFEAVSHGTGSILNVGIMAGVAPSVLTQAVHIAMEKEPNMTIRLHSNFADNLVTELVSGRCELIITHFDIRQFGTEELDVEVLYHETVGVVAAPTHPLAQRKRLKWRDLSNERWIQLPVETSTRRLVERTLLIYPQKQNRFVVETMEMHYLIDLVRDTGMLAALPLQLARWFDRKLNLVKCLPIIDELPPWAVCVARLRSSNQSAAAVLFSDCLKAASAQQHAKQGRG